MRCIGFFAGAFDPIHDGHIEVAKSAVDALGLSKLYFMVEESPWTDKKPIEKKHRTEMVKIATAGLSNISQLDLGIKQFNINETLLELEKKFNKAELYFVFGADVFLRMDKNQWPELEKLLKHYIVVFERHEITEKEISEYARKLGIVVAIIPSNHPNHRSTDVRLKPSSKSIWVPENVAKYIDDNGLYQSTN